MKKIGTLLLALGMIAVFAGCKKPTDEIVELTKIEITNPADKLEYLVGEDLDTTGLEITATYSDETTKVVTDWTPSGYDKTKAGEQTVKITYTENEITVETSYTVTVKEVPVEPEDPGKAPENPGDSDNKDSSNEPPKVELTKIEITAEPTQREYFVGAQELNLTGLKVTATYTDGTTPDVTDKVTTTGFESSAATESQTITVTYDGKTATFTVKILAVEVTKIEITTEPTRKVYYIGSSAFDLTGMVVTATYNNGTTADVTKDAVTSGFDSSAVTETQTITVTYGGKTATFTVEIKQGYLFRNAVTTLSSETTGSYGTDEATYVEFGDWPQDVVPVADVATLGLETSKDKVTRGYMEFVQGTDGNYYVKSKENANRSGYKYKKDNSDVGQGGTTSRWFKVMPIKWRVVDTEYDVDGSNGSETAKLLVAENILTANVPYYEDKDNYRTIDGKTVYPNNYKYSQIRAYLNGISYQGQSEEQTKWNNKGFLQTAFTSDAINKIITTKVDNSEDSTTNYDTKNGTITKATEYVCDPTDDKIFLLSEYEVTKYSKSTEAYNSFGPGNSRIKVTTDFAKANNAYQSTTNGYGGYWWLRSPYDTSGSQARYVSNGGIAGSSFFVSRTECGVVPALSISF